MELIKESLLEIVQTEAFAPIHVKARMPSEQAIEIDDSDLQSPAYTDGYVGRFDDAEEKDDDTAGNTAGNTIEDTGDDDKVSETD